MHLNWDSARQSHIQWSNKFRRVREECMRLGHYTQIEPELTCRCLFASRIESSCIIGSHGTRAQTSTPFRDKNSTRPTFLSQCSYVVCKKGKTKNKVSLGYRSQLNNQIMVSHLQVITPLIAVQAQVRPCFILGLECWIYFFSIFTLSGATHSPHLKESVGTNPLMLEVATYSVPIARRNGPYFQVPVLHETSLSISFPKRIVARSMYVRCSLS